MKTILLIDDDMQLRLMFKMALVRSGYRVIEADSGITGLALAKQHLPDLILSDIHMPGGDGSTLLHDLRRDPELRSRQVVLMTGRPDLVTPRSGMEDGADDFLIKPVSLEALRNCVEARFRRAAINWRVEDEMLAQLRSLVPSNLPHEFFTPLAGIIGLMEILQEDSCPLSPAEVKDIHQDVYISALRLHRTLRNYLLILDLQTQPARAETTPTLSVRKVEETIRAGVSAALRSSGDRKDDVILELSPSPLPGREEDLCLIVEELADNALKFSRRGTPVKIKLTPGGRLSFSDQGRGMTPEEISRIGAFKQFDRKKHEQQGLGLGLVLVEKLTVLVGARLEVKSEPGVETLVEIVFPSDV